MKKFLALAALIASLTLSGVAFAGSDNATPSQSGACHGAFADVNGNFGWLGPLGGTPGYHDAVGQVPGATGYNNSQGC
jgi:hypothetical protein